MCHRLRVGPCERNYCGYIQGKKPCQVTKPCALLAHIAVRPRPLRSAFAFVSAKTRVHAVYSYDCSIATVYWRKNPVCINCDVISFSHLGELNSCW